MGKETRDYGRAGRLGLGTPQANPTVEAEFRRLMPLAVEYFTLRLVSASDDPLVRLTEYLLHLPQFIKDQYAGLQIDGFMFACTASSYLVTPAAEAEIVETVEEVLGAPMVTAASALKHWLSARNAQRIAVATPYPEPLKSKAEQFWQAAGVDIIAAAQVDIGGPDTTGIYALQSDDARAALDTLAEMGADAIMISGTGMPSLSLVKAGRERGLEIVSSNVALAEAGLALLKQSTVPPDDWPLAD